MLRASSQVSSPNRTKSGTRPSNVLSPSRTPKLFSGNDNSNFSAYSSISPLAPSFSVDENAPNNKVVGASSPLYNKSSNNYGTDDDINSCDCDCDSNTTNNSNNNNNKSQYQHPSVIFLEKELPGIDEDVLTAGEELLDGESSMESETLKIVCKLLHLLDEGKYNSQEQLDKVFEVLKTLFVKTLPEKHRKSINFGDRLNPLAVAMIIAHFAPKSCKDYEDIKKFISEFCKIDRNNPCMAMFAWILAKSLHKEAKGEWKDEEAKKAIELRTVFIDAKIFVTENTDNHTNEFKDFCSDAGISMTEMNLIGAIIVGVHIKHYQLGQRKSPMAILLASTAVRNEIFPQWGHLFVPHGQVWGKSLKKSY